MLQGAEMLLNVNEEEMGNFRSYFVVILPLLITTLSIQAQESVNRETVAQVYELLQTRGHGTNDIAGLTPKINWKEVGASIPGDHRNTISFPAVIENRWGSVEFRDLVFKEVTKDEIHVTGTVSGRQHMECEYISNKFKHSWSLRDGEIVRFLEEF